ncbi:hypothetical protein JZ751_015380 [Albula glossodonta]|uniref:B30.2/SPRY domain-containing protein n=1 Tax=Albula glossodonta TaxID=121402 RepID=A0A8T2MXA4_9TELE|nr:hypothetical protein JZ751_015380 [Albula glossodonta]
MAVTSHWIQTQRTKSCLCLRGTGRFDYWLQVISRESLSERCYWEAEWSAPEGGRVSIAVTHKGIRRKGEGDENSWRLRCTESRYSVLHNIKETLIPAPPSPYHRAGEVGVCVDRPAGTLSFYSVSDSDTLTLLHTYHTSFTRDQPLCAGFTLYGNNSSVSLCQLDDVTAPPKPSPSPQAALQPFNTVSEEAHGDCREAQIHLLLMCTEGTELELNSVPCNWTECSSNSELHNTPNYSTAQTESREGKLVFCQISSYNCTQISVQALVLSCLSLPTESTQLSVQALVLSCLSLPTESTQLSVQALVLSCLALFLLVSWNSVTVSTSHTLHISLHWVPHSNSVYTGASTTEEL